MLNKLLLIIISLFLISCSSKVTIKSIKPSAVFHKDMKKISIDNFKNDSISLSNNIKSNMSDVYFNNTKYFNIVNRFQNEEILKEQKIQDSGLVNLSSDKVFEFGEINSIISGKINSTNYNTNRFYVTRTNYNRCVRYKYNNGKRQYCMKYRQYNVSCKNHNYNVNANITITSVINNDIIYSKNYNINKTKKRCSDDSKIIPNTKTVYNEISKSIAKQFVSLITPSYVYIKVKIKDSIDTDYTSKDKNILKNAIKLIELNDMTNANILLKKLVFSTKFKSITALYNYAITFEALGDLQNAHKYYEKAKIISLNNSIDEDVMKALKRIQKSIYNKQKANNQINK